MSERGSMADTKPATEQMPASGSAKLSSLPAGWTTATLATAVGGERRIVAGPFGSNLTQADYVEIGVPVIRGGNMGQRGRYLGGEFAYVTPEKSHSLKSNQASPGDIIVTQRGTLGQVSIVPNDLGFTNFVISQSQMAIQVDPEIIDRDFLYVFLTSTVFSRFVARSTVQTGLPHINLGLLREAPIIVPPKSEQQKIGGLVWTWDDTLEFLSRQINRKRELLQSLRERLVHGADRLGRRNSSWPMTALSDVTRQLTERNGDRYGRDLVMGVTKAEGIVPMREHVVAENISRYLVLPPHGFAYNPMRINIGSIAMSEHEGDVIVSPDYVVFACKKDRLHPHFFNHLRRTKAWADFMTIAGNGSVRVRIYYASLAEFEFHLPPLDEQRAIVEVLDDAELEISALEAERAAVARQRDALATELLTGRLRVPQAEAAS